MTLHSEIKIASYRCPFRNTSDKLSELNTGGLVGGISSLDENYDINWFCFDNEDGQSSKNNITVHKVGIDKETNKLYYGELCNNYLWPMFHYIRKVEFFRQEPWNSYVEANKKMAEYITKEVGKSDSILVNDYHLSLVPMELKKEGYNKISFFWHIPWVSPDYLKMFPWTYELVKGIAGADKIGFHTKSYAKNFLETAADMDDWIMMKENLKHKVISVPIGINYSTYHDAEIRRNKFGEELKVIKRKGIKIISSLSRLDYTKGILQKLEAFKQFLISNPSFQGKVVFVLVVSPSREEVAEYRWYKENIDKLVGSMNSLLRTPEWTPVIYIYRKISQSEVFSLYKESDVFLVTPVKDGLNLVAEEYISVNENGSLILSKFAGISNYIQATENINPFDVKEFSEAIYKILRNSPELIREKTNAMREIIKKYDINNWIEKMIVK